VLWRLVPSYEVVLGITKIRGRTSPRPAWEPGEQGGIWDGDTLGTNKGGGTAEAHQASLVHSYK